MVLACTIALLVVGLTFRSKSNFLGLYAIVGKAVDVEKAFSG
jgi:hypothetical protein